MGRAVLTNEIIDSRLVERKIKRLSNYPGNNLIKISWRCEIDGYIWEASTANILNRKGCPKCAGHLPITNEEIDKGLDGRNIERISNYPGKNSILMEWKCLLDGHIWVARANDIRSGKGCPKCAGNLPLTNEIVDSRLFGKNIKRIGNYTKLNEKIEWECLIDGHRWIQSPAWIFHKSRNTGCPLCNKPGKREKLIKKHIEHSYNCININHNKQLIWIGRFFYADFYLEYNNKIAIIEYHGQQHFKPVQFGGISLEEASIKYKKQKERDILFRKLCKEKNIPHLELKYDEKDLDVINKIKRFINEEFLLFETNLACDCRLL